MKILKNFSLVLLALTVIGTLAFNDAPVKKTLVGQWFVYTPTGSPNPFDPTQYTPDPFFDPNDNPDPCPSFSATVCAIFTDQFYTGTPDRPKVDGDGGAIGVTIDDHVALVTGSPSALNDGAVDGQGNIVLLKN
jgi:hypothetical protein